MNIKQIQYALEIAKTRNFTEAAKNMYVSQPSLSEQVNKLENELGFQIFVRRKGYPVTITWAGEEFLNKATSVTQKFKELQSLSKEYKQETTGTLRIGVLWTFGYTKIGKILNEFRKIHPEIKLQFTVDVSASLMTKFKNNKLDLIFVTENPVVPFNGKQIDISLISSSPLCFIVNQDQSLSLKRSISVSDLDGQNVLLPNHKSALFPTLYQKIKEYNVKLNTIGESSQADVICQFAELKIANGFLSLETFKNCVSQNLVAIPLAPTINRNIILIRKANTDLASNQLTLLLRSYIQNQL